MAVAAESDLRELRLARRLSLGVAAVRAGVSKSALANWENGVARPRGPAFLRLLDALEAEPRLRARLLHAADPAFARVELAHSPLGAPIDVGTVLRAMRARRGMTQADLARRVGLTQSAVAHWETGDAVPAPETVHAVGFALGATVEETLALASAQGGGNMGLPDDPVETLHQVRGEATLPALRGIALLGWEAELWRRATRDARWDACLIYALALRADWLIGQERWGEVAHYARRAVALVKTTDERRSAVPAVAALADADRHFGRGHAAAAAMAGAWAEALPDDHFRAWMIQQRGMCLARMGRGDEGAALVLRAAEMNLRRVHALMPTPWRHCTELQCEAYLAAGEPAKAAALVNGRRERDFPAWTYVRIEHANGRAVNNADMAYLRHDIELHQANPQGRRRLARMERRQARLTRGEPTPYAPGPTDDATRDRLWAAVLREHRG